MIRRFQAPPSGAAAVPPPAPAQDGAIAATPARCTPAAAAGQALGGAGLAPACAIRRNARLHAAILALLTAGAQAADVPSLGRLFNTPQQRAQLDAQRTGAAVPAPPSAGAMAPPAVQSPPPPPPPQVLNGVVKPAGGKATVWLNQEPLPDERRIVGRNGRITVLLPSGQRITLKPGQRYDETTGEVRDDTE